MNVVVFLVYFTFDSLLSHDLSLISDLDIMMKFTIMLSIYSNEENKLEFNS